MMDTDSLLQYLVNKSYTKADLNHRIRIIREFLEKKYFGKKKVSSTAPDVKALGKLKLSREFFASFDKNNLYPVLAKIAKAGSKLETIHLYLPFDLPETEKDKLGSWFKKNVGEHVLLELDIDRSLSLGCTFSAKGVFHDYSLNYFLKKKTPEINNLIGRYVKNTKT